MFWVTFGPDPGPSRRASRPSGTGGEPKGPGPRGGPSSNSTLLSICRRQSFSDCLRGFLDAELFIFAQTLPDVTLWSKTWTLVKIQVLPHFDLYPLQNLKQ